MQLRQNVRVCVPRYLQVGGGSVNGLIDLLKSIPGATRPLIVTDKVMVTVGIVKKVTDLLDAAGFEYGVFDEILPDPTDEVVLAGIAALEAGKWNCVIAVGGGSPLDAGKAIAVMSQGSRNIFDYRPPLEYSGPALPLVAIPTTAGTGSEVTHHTVLVHNATREKISCRGESFVPLAAIVDFELTKTKPRRLIADNALDTLTHAIEAYVSRKRTAFSDCMALDSMRLVGQYLSRAYADPNDVEAREGLMLAATLGGLAFSNASIGLVHAMSRPLGSSFHIPHGMSNAMLLAIVTRFSAPKAENRYAECARAIGLANASDSDSAAVEKLLAGMERYNVEFDVPTIETLGFEVETYRKEIERMAEDAIASGSPNNNPRVPTKAEIMELYEMLVQPAATKTKAAAV
jgi:alcohol dehydrogenase class IV